MLSDFKIIKTTAVHGRGQVEKTTSVAPAFFFLCSVAAASEQTANMGWPETIERLTQERTQAQTCVTLLKPSGDTKAIATGRITYGAAKAEADGVIAGLTTTLVEGGKPESLPKVQASLENAGAGLKQICDA